MKTTVEQKLMLEIMSIYFGKVNDGRLEDLVNRCNFVELDRLTEITGMDGFIYSAISTDLIKAIFPKTYVSNLRKRAGVITLKNSFIFKNGLEIIKLFNDNNIDYILIKGITILRHLYDDDTLRAVTDLDFLIRRDQYHKLVKLLEDRGFYYPRKEFAAVNLIITREEFESEGCEILFVKDTFPFKTLIDVNFDLSGFKKRQFVMHMLYPMSKFDWFGNTRTIEIDNCKVTCLNLEMSLLHMIYHFSLHHSFMGLKWLLDICQMIVKYNGVIDWNKFFKTLENANIKRLVGISLGMVSEITGVKSFGEYDLKEFLNTRINLNIYKIMMFEDTHTLKAKIIGKVVKVLLPVSFADKIKILKHYVFETTAINHRIKYDTGKSISLLQPFKLVWIILKEMWPKRGKNKILKDYAKL